MAELTAEQREVLAREIFSKTEIPLSKDDPIFALVNILSVAQDQQQTELQASTHQATTALKAVASLVEERASKLEHIIDAYIQTRVEAANASIDAETKRLTATLQEELHEFAGTLSEDIAQNLKMSVEKECITPIRDALDVIPQRTWLESIWTLAACLAIGFAVGFLYFDATIRYSLEYQLNAVTSKLPPIHAPTPKK
jgi:hypothetical protein